MVACAVCCAVGCASVGGPTHQSDRYIDQQVAERVGPDLAPIVEVPYRLAPEIVESVTGLVSPSASERKRVDQILDLIFSGRGLQYSLYPTRDATEAWETAEANCLSFVHLFVGIARSQRLNPFYVEVEDYQRWSFQDGAVVSRGHIVAGMYVDGSLATYDFLPYRAKSYKEFHPIDDLTAMAHHYNNLGAEALLHEDLETAATYLAIATRLAPDFDKAVNNLGVLYMRRGELEKARDHYLAARELHPTNAPMLNNLARTYQMLGDTEQADRVMDELASLDKTNPFFALYKGQQALDAGDTKLALKYMRDALRLDTEIPEVHLGLVKVYLAMGDIEKARHHVERALKLDATHEEARRYAAMLERMAPGATADLGGPGG